MNFQEHFKKIFPTEQFSAILGQDAAKKQAKSALLMGRHIVILGPPGIGKTTFAKSIAKILPETEVVEGCEYHCDPKNPICPGCKARKSRGETLKSKKLPGEQRFVRVQGSPDLTSEDLLGDIDPIKAIKYGPLSVEAFTPGKIFKANQGLLFFDELNRCPEKLQNSLLQVLEERTATIGSYAVDLPANFIFIGTMNPEDYAGTEKLSEVFMDRFDLIYMAYPESLETEIEIVKKKGAKIDIEFPEVLLNLMTEFVRHLRTSKDLERKPSVRASLGLYERAQSTAFLSARKKVIYGDITANLVSVLRHRIKLKPSLRYLKDASAYIKEEFKKFMESNSKYAQYSSESEEGGAG